MTIPPKGCQNKSAPHRTYPAEEGGGGGRGEGGGGGGSGAVALCAPSAHPRGFPPQSSHAPFALGIRHVKSFYHDELTKIVYYCALGPADEILPTIF